MAPVPPPAPLPSQPQTRIRLSTPGEILAAVPYLVGFAPRRSVVAICLRNKQVALTLRIDIDEDRELIKRVLVARARAEGADAVVLMLFDPLDAGGRGRRPGKALARELMSTARGAGLAVKDALGVREGRYWSYLCERPECCPPRGRPVPVAGGADHTKVAAPFIAEGKAPLASREELEASVALVTGPRREELEPAYAAARERPAAYPLERWESALRRRTAGAAGPGRELTTVESVRLIVSLGDVLVRDEILSWAATGGQHLVALLRDLAPLALPPYDVEVLSALAFVAYCRGEGSLAAVSLERASGSDPDHQLSLLLGDALECGISPDELAAVARDLVRDFSAPAGPEPSPDGW